jgi:hypothetical protein
MEAQGAKYSYEYLLENGCYIGEFVCDDDSSQRSIVCRKEDGAGRGVLPSENGPVRHLADINHRIRSMKGPFYNLVRAAKTFSTCQKSDAERLGRSLAFAVYMYSDLPIEDFRQKILCALEHHFDNHADCSSKWCRRKRELDGFEQHDENKKLHYRSKKEEPKLYKNLKEIFEEFTTDVKLDQFKDTYIVRICVKRQ